MDSQEFVESVSDDNETALSRLGSSKALYAITEGEMDDETVLAAAADRAHYAAETFDGWTDEADGDAAGAFEAAAEAQRDHYEAAVDDHDPGERPALFETLGGLDGDAERLGGLVGWTLVAGKTAEQLTGYFVGQADPQTAGTFRGFGDDLEAVRETALEAVADADADAWDAARDAADAVVQAAYDEYFETLESLGVNPKPVC